MAHLTVSVRIFAGIGLLILLAAPAFAQTDAHPEYAGTWNLNYGRSTYRPRNKTPEVVVVTLSGSTIEFRFTNDGKTYRDDTYTVDGNEHFLHENHEKHANPDANSTVHDRTYYSAEWKGGKDDVLAIHIRIATKETSAEPSFGAYTGYSYHAEEKWNLSPNRRVLVYRTVAEGLPNSLRVYDKQ